MATCMYRLWPPTTVRAGSIAILSCDLLGLHVTVMVTLANRFKEPIYTLTPCLCKHMTFGHTVCTCAASI